MRNPRPEFGTLWRKWITFCEVLVIDRAHEASVRFHCCQIFTHPMISVPQRDDSLPKQIGVWQGCCWASREHHLPRIGHRFWHLIRDEKWRPSFLRRPDPFPGNLLLARSVIFHAHLFLASLLHSLMGTTTFKPYLQPSSSRWAFFLLRVWGARTAVERAVYGLDFGKSSGLPAFRRSGKNLHG